MNKTLLMILLITGLFSFGSVLEAQAGTIFLYSEVAFDSQAQEVGGASATYVTYDIYEFYDPVVYGDLLYTNPIDFIDGDGGEGVNDYLFGLYPGYFADFTTDDYRPNKVLCTLGEHGLRTIFILGPQGYDPYQISTIIPQHYGADGKIEVFNQSDSYAPGDLIIVGYTAVCIQTPTVASVTYETINSAVTNDNPQSLGGGRRIFPDRQSPDDQTNRRIVRVRAQLANSGGTPAFTSGVRVYFRNFDVDDPSSDPIIDDTGDLGNDNREGRIVGNPYPPFAAGTLSNTFGITDANGVATVDFTVTRQPGDNFVIAASTDNTYLGGVTVNGTGLKDSTNQPLPTTRAKRTDLLTIWRKVHLEVDSMGPVGNNLAAGRTDRGTIGATPVWLGVRPNTGNLEIGRFQGGEMKFGPYRFEVLDNTETQLLIRSNNGDVTIFQNALFQLFDDDDFNDDDGPLGDGTLDGDDGEDVTFRGLTKFTETFSRMQPSTDINQNSYAAAYIEPDYTWAENQPGMNDTDVQFQLEITETLPFFFNEGPVVNERRDSAGMENNEFWIGYILIGYQSNRDFDPPGNAIVGIAPAVIPGESWTNNADSFLDVPTGSYGAIIYIEVMRDLDATIMGLNSRLKAAPHELGHQFGLLGDTSPLPPSLPNWGIMDSSESLNFVPQHIRVLRFRVASPGEEGG